MMVALGALVLCACGGAQTTAPSEENPDSTYSIYSGGAGWNFDYSLWVHDRELRYLDGTYAYFELSHSNYSSIIRPTVYNGDLAQSDILGTKVIEEATAENNGLLGEEGGWSLYTIKQSKTDNVLVAVKGNQRRTADGTYLFFHNEKRTSHGRPNTAKMKGAFSNANSL